MLPGAAGMPLHDQRVAAEAGEFQPDAGQKSDVGRQRLASPCAEFRLVAAATSLLFVDISLQSSAKAENFKHSLEQVLQ
jgi:hypothetical protein